MNCLMNILEVIKLSILLSTCYLSFFQIFSGLHDNPGDKIHWMCQSSSTGTSIRTNSPSALVVFTLRTVPLSQYLFIIFLFLLKLKNDNLAPPPQSEFIIRWKAVEGVLISETNVLISSFYFSRSFLWRRLLMGRKGEIIWNFWGFVHRLEMRILILQTPNYPSRYQKGAKCFWKIGKVATAHNETSLFNIKVRTSTNRFWSTIFSQLTFNDFDVPDPFMGWVILHHSITDQLNRD